MKIHQTNNNIDNKRPVISKPRLQWRHLKSIWSESQLQIAASLILTDKSLSNQTPTLSLFLMENKQWLNGGSFEMRRDVLQEPHTRCLITAEKSQRWQEQRTTPDARPPTCGPEPNIRVSGTFSSLQQRATRITSSSKPTLHSSTQTHTATCQVLIHAGKS